MPKPEPLALKAAIPTTESAIKIHGNEGEGARIMLDVYFEDLNRSPHWPTCGEKN